MINIKEEINISLKEEILNGESKKIEFKVDLTETKKILKTIIAFLNTSGGKIIIGVNNKKEIIGVEEDNIPVYLDSIANFIDDGCTPQIRPNIYLENIDDKNLIIVEVQMGYNKPYFIKSEGNNEGVYIRIAATTRHADIDTIKELEKESSNVHFDECINYEYKYTEENISSIISDYKLLANKDIDKTNLLNLKLLKQENNNILPTNSFILLTDKTNYFYNSKIRCAKFKGNDMTIFIDRKEFAGTVQSQIEEAINFCKTHIALKGIIAGMQREDIYDIPIISIREAIINAVVHRDYTIQSTDVFINIFDDRIEITSPGSLFGDLDIEMIKKGRSNIRNILLTRVLNQLNIIENWGTGIKKIFLESQKFNSKEPRLEELGKTFRITIYNVGVNVDVNVGVNVGVNDLQKNILNEISSNNMVTLIGLSKKLNITPKTVERNISTLKKKKLLTRVGADKNGYWQINS